MVGFFSWEKIIFLEKLQTKQRKNQQNVFYLIKFRHQQKYQQVHSYQFARKIQVNFNNNCSFP